MNQFYYELAEWWYLISPPEEYAEEAGFFLELLTEITTRPDATLLELGSGGGNNGYHMKRAFAHVTLSDVSAQMIALSQTLNPDCEHHVEDMRSMRLGREFDAVFIHDAIDYMTTLDDLRQALTTAYVHCKVGGMALFVPDAVRETFEPSTEQGGSDGEGRGARYLEWSHDLVPGTTTYPTDYVFVLHVEGEPTHVVAETHILGVFARADWLGMLAEVGFSSAEIVRDAYEREIFVAYK